MQLVALTCAGVVVQGLANAHAFRELGWKTMEASVSVTKSAQSESVDRPSLQ